MNEPDHSTPRCRTLRARLLSLAWLLLLLLPPLAIANHPERLPFFEGALPVGSWRFGISSSCAFTHIGIGPFGRWFVFPATRVRELVGIASISGSFALAAYGIFAFTRLRARRTEIPNDRDA